LFDRESFDEQWPALADRLRRSLTARGVPAQDRDDVVQETALRVYRSWASLDPNRPAWPFVITVAVNIWRDVIRERTGRIAQVHPTDHLEVTADQDVERDVLARQELASTVVAIRSLAPEQRRLLLATEDFGETGRPLRPAERVARMRVRRQLARTVGRASAALVLLWLRRPARTSGAVATAYAGALAAAVLTSPAMAPMPAISALPAPPAVTRSVPHAGPIATGPARAALHRTGPRASQAATAANASALTNQPKPIAATPIAPTAVPQVRTKICAPTRLPLAARVGLRLRSTVVYGSDGAGGWQPVAATPPVAVRSGADCVAARLTPQ
jgi:DNA-directed RNA polymerase specialized sigma24 family protein